jgi:hypothetical protein
MARYAAGQISTYAVAKGAGGSWARRAATTIAYLSPALVVLSFLAWTGTWFDAFGWSVSMAAIDVEWFLILAGPVVGCLASIVGTTLAFRSRQGRVAAVFAIVGNLLLALLVWSFSTSFTGVVG